MYRSLGTGVFLTNVERQIQDGVGPTINMGTIIKDAEPGEILNSPKDIQQETRDEGEVDMWSAGDTHTGFDPVIRRDNRYGLHYLKRGDEVTIVSQL